MDIRSFFKNKKDGGNEAQARGEEVEEDVRVLLPHLQAQVGEEEGSFS